MRKALELEVKEETAQNDEYYSQPFQSRLNIWEFEEDGFVRNTLIIKHKADPPDHRREANILGAGQVI